MTLYDICKTLVLLEIPFRNRIERLIHEIKKISPGNLANCVSAENFWIKTTMHCFKCHTDDY